MALENQVSLATLRKGSAIELVDEALQDVWANIRDANTDPKAERTVTLTLKFKPEANRMMTDVEIEVKSKLAHHAPVESKIVLGRHGAEEYVSPQLDLDDLVGNVSKMGAKKSG